MRIIKAESNQQSFGTKVYATKETKKVFSKLRRKSNILEQIKDLKNNGNEDMLLLSAKLKKDSIQKEYNISADLVKVSEENPDKYYTNPFFESETLSKELPDGTISYVDLKGLYSILKEELIPIRFESTSFKNLLAKYKEL